MNTHLSVFSTLFNLVIPSPFSSPSSLPQSGFLLFSIPFNSFPSPSSISSSVDIHPILICIIIHSVRNRESSQESFSSTPISGGSWVSLSLYSLLPPSILLPFLPSLIWPTVLSLSISSSIIPSYYTWEGVRKGREGDWHLPSFRPIPFPLFPHCHLLPPRHQLPAYFIMYRQE